MGGLAEADLAAPERTAWWPRLLALVAIGLVFLAIAWWLKGLIASPAEPKRQVAKISILPDTPPPPPPPPKEEKRPEPPKQEPKQVVREEQLKPDVPKPANEQIKMEGAAGEGPSAFGSGNVTKEYQGGPTIPAASAAAAGSFADRTQERFYANSARQLLRDEIERHLKPDAGEVVAIFALWIEPDGRIRKIELAPGAAASADADLRTALDETSRQLRLPVPGAIPQPLRFRMTMRAAG